MTRSPSAPSPPPTPSATSTPWAAGPSPRSPSLAFPRTAISTSSQPSSAAAPKRCAKPAARVLGGHSVNDPEIKFGYAVTGLIHPDRIKTNAGARPGDVLVFTKHLAPASSPPPSNAASLARNMSMRAIESMLTLNRTACEAMLAFDVHACTDVTGFGLTGHAREMAMAANVTLEIRRRRSPLPARRARLRAHGSHPRRPAQ